MAGSESIQTVTMNVTDARQHFSELLATVFRGENRFIVEEGGKPVAAIVSPRDLAWLCRYEEQRAADFAVLDRISAAFADVSEEEIEREVAKALAEVRAEMRAEREQAQHGA